MIQKGKVVKSDSGSRIRVDGPFLKKTYDPNQKKVLEVSADGGQAKVYWATEMGSGQKGVLKIFHSQFANENTSKRIRFLFNKKLATICPALCSPIDIFSKGNILGHFTPAVPGESLEELLKNPNFTFQEGLQIAIALSHALEVMHEQGMAHGDMHSDNLIILKAGSVFQVHIIDLDNFNAPGVPPPNMVGHNLYLAPELRKALAEKRPAIPNKTTDRFSVAVIFNESILLFHPAAGDYQTEEDFKNAMCRGEWVHHPESRLKPSGQIGGYPVEVLNSNLMELFSLSFSLDPSKRPSPGTWKIELANAFNSIDLCSSCGGLQVVDDSKTHCPRCKEQFPHLVLVVEATGASIPLGQETTRIGRRELGGSMKVSASHAVFRNNGPKTWLESFGMNGTRRWNGSRWCELKEKTPHLVQAGDRLQFGDVVACLEMK